MSAPVLRRDDLHRRLQLADDGHHALQRQVHRHVDLVEGADARPVGLIGPQALRVDVRDAAEQVSGEEHPRLRVVQHHRAAEVAEGRGHRQQPVAGGHVEPVTELLGGDEAAARQVLVDDEPPGVLGAEDAGLGRVARRDDARRRAHVRVLVVDEDGADPIQPADERRHLGGHRGEVAAGARVDEQVELVGPARLRIRPPEAAQVRVGVEDVAGVPLAHPERVRSDLHGHEPQVVVWLSEGRGLLGGVLRFGEAWMLLIRALAAGGGAPLERAATPPAKARHGPGSRTPPGPATNATTAVPGHGTANRAPGAHEPRQRRPMSDASTGALRALRLRRTGRPPAAGPRSRPW